MPRFTRKTYARSAPPPTGFVTVTMPAMGASVTATLVVTACVLSICSVTAHMSKFNTPTFISDVVSARTDVLTSFRINTNQTVTVQANLTGGVHTSLNLSAHIRAHSTEASLFVGITDVASGPLTITPPVHTVGIAGTLPSGWRRFVNEVETWGVPFWPDDNWDNFITGTSPFLVEENIS